MSTSISSLKDQVPVVISAIEVISKDYKWKYANFFKIPSDQKKKIIIEFDESVTAMISLLETEYNVAPEISITVCEELIEQFKSDLLTFIKDR